MKGNGTVVGHLNLYSKGKSVTAINSNKDMVEIARKNLNLPLDGSPRENSRFSVRLMDAHDLKFEDKTFDTVVNCFTLCSFDDPHKVLKEMKRVCKPRGTVLLVVYENGPEQLSNQIKEKYSQQIIDLVGCGCEQNVSKMLADVGLVVESRVEISLLPHLQAQLFVCKC